MASSVANALSTMAGVLPSNSGSVNMPGNAGKTATPQSGVRRASVPAPPPAPGPRQTPQTQVRAPQQQQMRRPPLPHPAQRPAYSAQNPPLGTAPPPIPHPGLVPPYPDARSPQPTMSMSGVPIMPPPPNVMGVGMHPMGPRVPMTFTPGMTGLLGR